jgi:hypothetical protein
MDTTRRGFLEQVGQGALLASVGPALTAELGLGGAEAAEAPPRLHFGKREPLVQLLQETLPAKILPVVVGRLRAGTALKELVAAAALANVRALGGEDYDGYHTMMALVPCYAMARELPAAEQALPVLKVLYRNSTCLAHAGGKEVLRPVAAGKLDRAKPGPEALRAVVRKRDLRAAEQTFAALAGTADAALDGVLCPVEDDVDVHRVVMLARSWELLDLVGKEQAHTLLRQSVHFCIQAEGHDPAAPRRACRTVLPKMLEAHKLLGKTLGGRKLADAAVGRLSQQIFKSTPEQAAGLVAEALADGIAPDAVGEAVTLATCELLLRDEGRPKGQASGRKPVGSVHGDSIGVHACDSANAWRNLARFRDGKHAASCLILAGFQAANDRTARGGDFLHREPYPRKPHREKVAAKEPAALLKEADGAIKDKDQAHAAAAVHRYLELGGAAKEAFALLLRYAVSQDGALHAEKFYRTCREEHARTRAAFRGRFLVALTRVTASAYGQPAPGLREARKLLEA